MWEYLKNPDTILAIITAIIAIYALYQTGKQIKLSNKQHLFDRRVDKFILVKRLLSLYSRNREKLKSMEGLYENVEPIFRRLTNVTALKEMNIAVRNPLEEGEGHEIFLTICEKLLDASTEIELIWKGKEAGLVSEFVKKYEELLNTIYVQQIYIASEIESPTIPPDSLENKAKQMADMLKIEKLIKDIDCLYEEIIKTNAEAHLKKQIKL